MAGSTKKVGNGEEQGAVPKGGDSETRVSRVTHHGIYGYSQACCRSKPQLGLGSHCWTTSERSVERGAGVSQLFWDVDSLHFIRDGAEMNSRNGSGWKGPLKVI